VLALVHGASAVQLWERGTWRTLTPLAASAPLRLQHLASSADGSQIAAYGVDSASPERGLVVVLDVAAGRELARWSPRRTPISAVAFLARTRCIATGDEDGHLEVWQLGASATAAAPSRLAAVDLRGGQGPFGRRITGLAFSPAGDRLVAGLGLDGDVVVIFDVTASR